MSEQKTTPEIITIGEYTVPTELPLKMANAKGEMIVVGRAKIVDTTSDEIQVEMEFDPEFNAVFKKNDEVEMSMYVGENNTVEYVEPFQVEPENEQGEVDTVALTELQKRIIADDI